MKRQRLFAVMGTVIVLSLGLLLMTGTLSAQSGRDRTTAIDLSAVTQNREKCCLQRTGSSSFRRSTTGPSGTTKPASYGKGAPDEMARPWSEAISICAERPVVGRFACGSHPFMSV